MKKAVICCICLFLLCVTVPSNYDVSAAISNPKPPTLSLKLNKESGINNITVKWKPLKDHYYIVQRKRGDSNMYLNLCNYTKNMSTLTDDFLEADKYTYRVKVYKIVNKKKYFSDWSTKKSLVIKAN